MNVSVRLSKLFLTALCVFMVTDLGAQEPAASEPPQESGPISRFGLQVQASVNYMSPSTAGFHNEGVRMSVQPTFFADFKVHDNIRLGLGLRYGSRNGHLRYSDANAEFIGKDVIRTYILRSLDIPLAVKAYTNEFGSWSFFGAFGFTPSFVLSAKAVDLYEGIVMTMDPEHPGLEGDYITRNKIQKQIQTFDVAASIQAGFEYRFGRSTALSMSLGSDIWLLNTLSKHHYNAAGGHPIAHVRQFFIAVGIVF